jgi:hypothetical protein
MRRISTDPEVQPNPQVMPCGCVFTCYEDDEAEPPYNKVAELVPCRPDCEVVSGTLQLADDMDTHAEVRLDLP